MQGITNGLSASIHYNPRGQWVSGNNYSIDDWLYDEKGQYICIAPISASTTAPSQDTTHFTKTAVVQTTSGTITQGDFLTIDENGNIVDSLKNADDFLEEDDLPTHLPQTSEVIRYEPLKVANWVIGDKHVAYASNPTIQTLMGFCEDEDLTQLTGWYIVTRLNGVSTTYKQSDGNITVSSSSGELILRTNDNKTVSLNSPIGNVQNSKVVLAEGFVGDGYIDVRNSNLRYSYYGQWATSYGIDIGNCNIIVELEDDPSEEMKYSHTGTGGYDNRFWLRRKSTPTAPIPIKYKINWTDKQGQVTLINHYIPAIEVNPTSAVDDTLNKIKINGVTYQFAFADPHKAKIYGVTGLNQSNPTLTRTDDAVGLTYTATGSSNSVVSDFDNCYPWSDMRLVTDSEGNSFIRVPKFYHKMETNNGIITWKISGVRYAGYSTYFTNGNTEVDFIDIGCYEGSVANSKLCSKPNVSVTASQTIATFRTQALANGTGYHLYDFKSDIILKALFTIEFATTNSQSIFMGNTSTSAGQSTGTTDDNMAKSGVANANTLQSSVSFKYRGIENLFGNCWKFVDGIGFYDSNIYLCLDPTKYANIADYQNLPTGYRLVGTRGMTNGYAKTMGLLADNGYLYTSDVGGSTTTYYSDYYYQATSYRLLFVGGAWYGGAYAGLWYWTGFDDWSSSSSNVGARLCKTPV